MVFILTPLAYTHSTGIPFYGYNSWTGSFGSNSLRHFPLYYPGVTFYTQHAGKHDEMHCGTLQGVNNCAVGAEFEVYDNVKAQLNVGSGTIARQLDFDFSVQSIYNVFVGDSDGVGHIRAKTNTGEIIHAMLTGDCELIGCVGDYAATIRGKLINTAEAVTKRAWNVSGMYVSRDIDGIKAQISQLSADVDLYLRKDAAPTTQNYDCRPYFGGTAAEICDLTNIGSGNWYIAIYGYQAGAFKLTVQLK